MATKKSPKKTSLKKLSIKLHREIYKEAAVKEAAREYSALADFSISGSGAYITAVITPKGGVPAERVEAEFVNMALCNSI
ncbi:MAG TPA: hypothetical protein DCZ92_14460 [Elusimicrobia bacterium]|nr:MAG: hypothetical protein A2016_09055 [Elusimicrobia bacterium GWF2_62_30]HBA61986.1 hypothetical protein [Elusimicrobiota bacterium]